MGVLLVPFWVYKRKCRDKTPEEIFLPGEGEAQFRDFSGNF